MSEDIKPGQVFILKDPDRYDKTGFKDDIMIILDLDSDDDELGRILNVGFFWWSGERKTGGCRQTKLTEKEIRQIGEPFGHIEDLYDGYVTTSKSGP